MDYFLNKPDWFDVCLCAMVTSLKNFESALKKMYYKALGFWDSQLPQPFLNDLRQPKWSTFFLYFSQEWEHKCWPNRPRVPEFHLRAHDHQYLGHHGGILQSPCLRHNYHQHSQRCRGGNIPGARPHTLFLLRVLWLFVKRYDFFFDILSIYKLN